MQINIAIVDDHPLMLTSIETTVKAALPVTICGVYTTGDALIEGFRKAVPEVLLLDYHLQDTNGAQLARFVSYHYPQVRIIVLTGFDKPGLSYEMLENGCMGYLLKTSANAETLIEAISTVLEGRIYLDRSLTIKNFDKIKRDFSKDTEQARASLTSREIEVLKAISDGLSSQEIAEKLFISKRTVDNHRTSIIMKTGVRNSAELIKFATERKLT